MPNATVSKAASQPADPNDVEKPSQYVIEMAKIGLATSGAALVAYFAYRLARRKDDRTNFLAAGAKFREAFAPELAAAEADDRNEINYMEFLRTAYQRHEQAVMAFEHFMPLDRRRSFTEDWNRYRYGENDKGATQMPAPEDMDHASLYFLEYSIEWDLRSPKRPRENTINRIRKLLSYASAA
jgi:hypothetical protein